jgi:hypothetical protein
MNPIRFAPACNAATVVTAAFPRRWHMIDLCESPIAGASAIGSGQATQFASLTAEVATNGSGDLLGLAASSTH